ncbi:MAG: hypothetical protein AB8U25_03170 [Rickettsiales endosymbiont of Dermacentor nuttalli]
MVVKADNDYSGNLTEEQYHQLKEQIEEKYMSTAIGLPEDNKYSNMQEARLTIWEDTILPLLDHTIDVS